MQIFNRCLLSAVCEQTRVDTIIGPIFNLVAAAVITVFLGLFS